MIRAAFVCLLIVSGTFQLMHGDDAGLSQPSMSRIVQEVSSHRAQWRRSYISFPSTPQQAHDTQNAFCQHCRFPGMIGAIGCTPRLDVGQSDGQIFCECTGIQTKELESSEYVTAVKGSSAALHCASSNKDLKLVLVEWEKTENRTKIVVFHVATNATTLHSERIKLGVNGHRSTITITGVQPADSGGYTCIFHTYPDGKIEGKVYLDVNGKKPTSNLATNIIASVVPVVIAIGILFLLLYFGHRNKRIHTPNQINVLLHNTSDANNQDTARRLSNTIPPNSDGEVPDPDYFSVALRTSL